MNRQTKESAKSAYLSAGKEYNLLSKVFVESLIDLFAVRPVWMLPSVHLNLCNKCKKTFSHQGDIENTLDSSSCTDSLISLRG